MATMSPTAGMDLSRGMRAARDTLMKAPMRRVVGTTNAVLGVAAVLALVSTYGLAERLVSAQEQARGGIASEMVALAGAQLVVSLATSLLLVGAAGGFLGSVIQQSITFANRAGKDTLEGGYVWWYVLRPVWSALLGSVAVLAVNVGVVSIGDETTSVDGVTVLATAAVVAGIFTDQTLKQLGRLTAAGDPERLGSDAESTPRRDVDDTSRAGA
jgi:hypothetical protein